jgi:hypothetical protein
MSFTVILSIGFTFIICLSASASASFVPFAIARSPPLNVFFTSYSIAQILPLGKSFLHFSPFVLTAEKPAAICSRALQRKSLTCAPRETVCPFLRSCGRYKQVGQPPLPNICAAQ